MLPSLRSNISQTKLATYRFCCTILKENILICTWLHSQTTPYYKRHKLLLGMGLRAARLSHHVNQTGSFRNKHLSDHWASALAEWSDWLLVSTVTTHLVSECVFVSMCICEWGSFISLSEPIAETGHWVSMLMFSTGMRLKFHTKSGSSEFSGIPDCQSCNITLEMNRCQSQLSVELWILKIQNSKVYRKLELRSIQF